MQDGARRGVTGVPAARTECNSIQTDDECGVVSRECCDCCKLGQLIRMVLGIDECSPRAEIATFDECRPVFLACCLDETGMFSKSVELLSKAMHVNTILLVSEFPSSIF